MEIDLVFGGHKGTAPDLSDLGRILATNPDNIKGTYVKFPKIMFKWHKTAKTRLDNELY